MEPLLSIQILSGLSQNLFKYSLIQPDTHIYTCIHIQLIFDQLNFLLPSCHLISPPTHNIVPPILWLTRNYCLNHVQIDQHKSWSTCMVDNARSGIHEIQGLTWRVIHRGTWLVYLGMAQAVISHGQYLSTTKILCAPQAMQEI